MSPVRRAIICVLLILGSRFARPVHAQPPTPHELSAGLRAIQTQATSSAQPGRVAPAEPLPTPVPSAPSRAGESPEHLPVVVETFCDDVFAGYRELPLPVLVNMVLAQHPSVASAIAAWRAAAARYPQAVSFADPMLDTMMAPGSLGSPNVDFAWVVQGRQTIPWSGKRQLRGNVAQHEARAAMQQVGDARLQLVQITKQAYYEYYLAHRQLELNTANRLALGTFRANALDRYEANLVPQQDVLQADVELADLERAQIEFERLERVAAARINTLLLRYPATPLPPPPVRLSSPVAPPAPNDLLGIAQASRPDLAAAVSKLRAEQAGVSLAQREFKPDVELVGRYDTFWQGTDRPLQGQVGLNMNVPVQRERRRAAVREASAGASQQRAEVERLSAQIQYEVQVAYERVRQAYREVQVFDQRIIPAANSNVNAAQAAYVTGKVDFLRLVQAQRERIDLLNEQAAAVAAYYVGLAELERVIGGALPASMPSGGQPAPTPR